jgi:hypothetical protein
MKPARTILLAVSVLALAALACSPFGGSDDEATATFPPTRTPADVNKGTPTPLPDSPTPEPEEPTPEPPTKQVEEPTPTPEAESSLASLLIANESPVTVFYLYISSSDADEWGDDMLGDDVLEPGESYLFTDIPPGDYDIKAEDLSGNIIETAWEVRLEGEVELSITAPVVITIVNESSSTIAEVNISPVESDDWGDDWLGGDTISPGDTYTLWDIPGGYYDLRLGEANGDSIETLYNVALFGEQEWVVYGVASVPENAVLRFEDDFSDNQNNWGNVDTEHTTFMAPAGGEYCMLIKVPDNTAWEWYEPFRTDEFVAEVECYVDGTQDATCGIGFGPDGDNFFWYEVSAYDQHYALFLQVNNEWQDKLIEWTESSYIDPYATNYLAIERVGGMIRLLVNGMVIDEVWYEGFYEGRIGIGGATYSDPNATVCLDNLRVWRLE